MNEGRPPVPLISVILAVCLIAGAAPALTARDARELPARLTDQEFWALIVESSEPDGYFRSDNLTSNELGFQAVIPDLLGRTKPGRAYLGVGPEQCGQALGVDRSERSGIAEPTEQKAAHLVLRPMDSAFAVLARGHGGSARI